MDKKSIGKIIARIKSYDFSSLKDWEINDFSQKMKKKALETSLDDILPEAFALVCKAIKISLNIEPFDTQIYAAISMANGNIIEFPTGEGKTIVAVFVAYLNALTAKGVHILTFNDYLAERDATWMKPAYDMLGISVSYINEKKSTAERRKAYNSDVTYLTVKEAGYDYIRNFLVYDTAQITQRAFNMAIVDEADSIMLDNARIPLIVAGDAKYRVHMDKHIYELVKNLTADIHYNIDYYAKTISLTDDGYSYFEKRFSGDIYSGESPEVLVKVNLFLRAEFLLKRDIDYIVKDGEIKIIDEFTGRIMKDCKWPDGIQAAVETKERVSVRETEQMMDRITIQNFLSLYPRLCGMTGTALPSANEFREFYGKQVDVIPPNKPCVRIDNADVIFSNRSRKYAAILDKVLELHELGRPILIGTSNIIESEQLAVVLKKVLPDIKILNAKNDAEEAQIIANAGQLDAITISTNIAGRGVDIRLGGKDGLCCKQVVALGGLFIIGTNRHDSIRIDNQLRGRSGRQGDPGESVFYISLDDPLFVKYGLKRIIPPIYKKESDLPITGKAVRKAITHIQKVVEGQSLNAKVSLSKYSLLYEKQRLYVHKMRENVLNDILIIGKIGSFPSYIRKNISDAKLRIALKAITLYSINDCWAKYLLDMEMALDEIGVIGKSVSSPVDFYNQKLHNSFSVFEKRLTSQISEACKKAQIKNGRIDLEMMGIHAPTSTKTYMLLDGTEDVNLINELAAASNPISAPLFMAYLVVAFFKKKRKYNIK